jgi:tetratricopeptide (TPR) repeat protein
VNITFSKRIWIGALAFAGASSFVAAEPAPTDWTDVEGRIQYAYYTSDARALETVLTGLKAKKLEEGEEAPKDDATMRAYFRGLANYRLAQVLVDTKKSKAKDAIGDCEDAIDDLVAALPKVPIGLDEKPDAVHQRAEGYALATACTLAGREMSSIALLGGRVGSRYGEAVKLEPKNPRVRLVEALVLFDDAGKDGVKKTAAIGRLRAVTQMFEQARAGASTIPEWGAAEAYAWLGRALYDQRDVVGAREALERSLLIAPDYAFARKLMGQITR